MRRPLLALAALATTTPALGAPASVATPAGSWEASNEGGVCRVQRGFDVGGKPHLLILEQNAPGVAVGIAMAGPSLAALSPDAPLRVSFAADHPGFDKQARIEPNQQFGHVAVVQGVWLDKRKPSAAEGPGRIDIASAQGVEQIAVSQGDEGVSFATGPLAEAATALNACTARIMLSWGLDPAAQYAVTERAQPVEPKTLAKEMQKSYPRGATRGLRSGPLEVAALIDEAGAATECKIIVPSPWSDLDVAACKAISHARFTPARGADGRPVDSFWKTRVTFYATKYEAELARP